MQASKTAIEGSNTIALPEVLGILGERFHRFPLSVHLCLQREHVLELRAAMLADISKRQIAHIHPMDNERAGYPQNLGCVVRAELLIFREHGDSFALEEATEGGLKQGRGLRW